MNAQNTLEAKLPFATLVQDMLAVAEAEYLMAQADMRSWTPDDGTAMENALLSVMGAAQQRLLAVAVFAKSQGFTLTGEAAWQERQQHGCYTRLV
jgi:hypothetical protein